MTKKDKKPSAYTLIYWQIQDRKLDPETLFTLLELYWPTFLKKDKYVFLKEQFSDEKYDRLINQKINPEYWINLLTVNEFFENSESQNEMIAFINKLIEIWQTKLKNDFPLLNFTVEYLQDPEYGDYGLTFYQND